MAALRDSGEEAVDAMVQISEVGEESTHYDRYGHARNRGSKTQVWSSFSQFLVLLRMQSARYYYNML